MTSQINMVVWVYWYILSLGDLWELQIPRLHMANRGSAGRVLGWASHGLVILAKVIDCTMVGEYLQHMGVLAHVQRSRCSNGPSGSGEGRIPKQKHARNSPLSWKTFAGVSCFLW